MTGPAAVHGKVALVTGSSRGVGFRIAERLAEAGAVVFINGRSAERGEQAAAELRQASPDVRFVASDCACYPDAAAVVDTARSLAGRLDILISAGAEGDGPAPFAEMTPEQIESTIRTRLLPRIFPVHAALPALRGTADRLCCSPRTPPGSPPRVKRRCSPPHPAAGRSGCSPRREPSVMPAAWMRPWGCWSRSRPAHWTSCRSRR